MKIKYLSSKVVLVGSAVLATPALAIGFLLQSSPHQDKPQDLASSSPMVQPAKDTAPEEPMIIRVIVIRSSGGPLEAR